ncbi:hypothetical protein [Rhizobium halophytocola]|uniref:DUF320 domain-containing protein n=1 Tax=Rhizobium halophytocola TaxID=735519 RepID=A0ABS4DTF7_9HYPH|nr:hypothetical protein [Rhizobium halophytocola]MBP1848982.1 hypothetical protein [Rhizobium halophytocola]
MIAKLATVSFVLASVVCAAPAHAGMFGGSSSGSSLINVSPNVNVDRNSILNGNAILSGNNTSVLSGILSGNSTGVGILNGGDDDHGSKGKKKRHH